MFAANIKNMRKQAGLSQEQVAEKLNVSRQAVAKWESGESMPDLYSCRALAELYDVTTDDMLEVITKPNKTDIRPKGKHIFGAVRVQKDGSVKLPKKALDVFNISNGEFLIVLGDEEQGIALCKATFFADMIKYVSKSIKSSDNVGDEKLNVDELIDKILNIEGDETK